YWRRMPFTWFERHDYAQGVAVCLLLIVLLAIRAVGTRLDRIVSIAHFVGSAWLLSKTQPYMTVNEELYLMGAFWSCFVPLNTASALQETDKPPHRWPLDLFCFGIGVTSSPPDSTRHAIPSGRRELALECSPRYRGTTVDRLMA